MNYHKIAFTDAVKAEQERMQSRVTYARSLPRMERPGLGDFEREFIAARDSFYLSSVGANGFPYTQHRGGPAGFLRVLDDHTLGFLDFAGNRQYITLGNLKENDKVALFLMSYAERARLKIYATARIATLEDNPQLVADLTPSDYSHRAERVMLFDVQAFDWNCSQHITPRFTAGEIETVFEKQK